MNIHNLNIQGNSTKKNGKMVNVMEKEQILGQVVKFTLVNGKIKKYMVRIMLQVSEFLG